MLKFIFDGAYCYHYLLRQRWTVPSLTSGMTSSQKLVWWFTVRWSGSSFIFLHHLRGWRLLVITGHPKSYIIVGLIPRGINVLVNTIFQSNDMVRACSANLKIIYRHSRTDGANGTDGSRCRRPGVRCLQYRRHKMVTYCRIQRRACVCLCISDNVYLCDVSWIVRWSFHALMLSAGGGLTAIRFAPGLLELAFKQASSGVNRAVVKISLQCCIGILSVHNYVMSYQTA